MSKTILLVEDDENDVFFMKRAAKKLGLIHELQVAEDGQEAIDYLGGIGAYADRERFPFPGLVLLDLKLPRVMGFDVLRWIRKQAGLQGLVVIVLTASNLGPDIDMAYQLGANSFLVKPAADELAELISTIVHYCFDLDRPEAIRGEFMGTVTANNGRGGVNS